MSARYRRRSCCVRLSSAMRTGPPAARRLSEVHDFDVRADDACGPGALKQPHVELLGPLAVLLQFLRGRKIPARRSVSEWVSTTSMTRRKKPVVDG